MTSPRIGAFQHALSLYALAGELRATDPVGADMAMELGDRVYPAMLPIARTWRKTIVRDHGGDVAAAARAEMQRRGWPCNP